LELTQADCTPPQGLPEAPEPFDTEEAFGAYRERAREAHRQRVSLHRLHALLEGMERVAQDGASAERRIEPCEQHEIEERARPGKHFVQTVDFADLQAHLDLPVDGGMATPQPSAGEASETQGFDWLTSSGLTKVLTGEGKEREVAARTVTEATGRLLVVYKSDERRWPRIGPAGTHEPGRFRGWLMVYDLEFGKRLCQTELGFDSGNQLNAAALGLSAKDARIHEMFDVDMEAEFRKAATAALKTLTSRLNLGYMAVE
jgi:hypothetical protein